MKKYYIPEIEDFHEGLEFEENIYDENLDEFTGKWEKHIFDSRGGLGNELTHVLEDRQLRVKYLDQEDIEDFDFSYWTDSHGYWRCFKTISVKWYLCLRRITNTYIILEKVEKKVKGERFEGCRHVLFNGVIKNKSELRKMFKQVGHGEL